MEDNIKILVCCHKEVILPHSSLFLPIAVGAERSSSKLSYLPDNTGDNISSLNREFCELTALYWAWKNLKNVSVLGLNHYRRFFCFERKYWKKPQYIIPPNDLTGVSINQEYIDSILKEYDIIMPIPIVSPYSVGIDYCINHIIEDLRILKECIECKYPSYLNSFNSIMNGNKLSPYNMFIMSYNLLERYCQWLFDILFAVKIKVCVSDYPQQARVFGYMGERLLNVYVKHHHLKVKYLPIYYVGNSIDTNFLNFKLNSYRFDLIHSLISLKTTNPF